MGQDRGPAAKIDSEKTIENTHTTWLGLSLILVAVVLVVLFSLVGIEQVVTIELKEGISVFAVFYLMAQFIERALEPFSEQSLRKNEEAKPDTKTEANTRALFSDTDRIKALRKEKKRGLSSDEEDELEKLIKKRVIAMWGLASFLGILLCYFAVGLFETVGVSFQNLAIGNSVITGHTVDAILSGVIVGAGTKSLHDLIGYLQKESTKDGSS